MQLSGISEFEQVSLNVEIVTKKKSSVRQNYEQILNVILAAFCLILFYFFYV